MATKWLQTDETQCFPRGIEASYEFLDHESPTSTYSIHMAPWYTVHYLDSN